MNSGTTAAPHPDPHNSTPNLSPRATTAWPRSRNHRNPRKTKRYAFEINTSTCRHGRFLGQPPTACITLFEYHSGVFVAIQRFRVAECTSNTHGPGTSPHAQRSAYSDVRLTFVRSRSCCPYRGIHPSIASFCPT